ncbi:MAG: hypothetical protein PHH51_00075 [Bacilli bacterium]|nr:hypothetical protein [Bacilli bacterium]MDD3895517.1 hypothetical protein [Bacilli bacterium]MDD4407571.1 hypothetical protein [Bacilli bacterium]
MKKNFTTIKELWNHPVYKSLMKLGGYTLFFIIFFIIAVSGRNDVENHQDKNINKNFSYNEMKNNLINNNLKIKYHIISNNEYYIEGTIINKIFNGTLEQDDTIKKIKIDQENIYLIEKNTEKIDESILSDINLIYIFPSNIVNIINENASIMKQNENQKIYSYTIDKKAYSVFTTNDAINKIIILDNSITYELEIEIIS